MIPERTEKSKQGLLKLVTDLKDKYPIDKWTIIEIGAYTGCSTEIFCKHFGHVYSIDPWESNIGDITNMVNMDEVFKIYINRVKDFTNLTIMKNYSFDVANQFEDESVDIIYIDGGHEYEDAQTDLDLYYPKVKKSGVIAGHDYCNKFPGVMKAVDEKIGKLYRLYPDTSWMGFK